MRSHWIVSMFAGAAALTLAPASPCAAQTLASLHIASVPGPAIFATHAPGDPTRLFVVQQNGRIDIVELPGHTLKPTPFLASLPNLVSGGEAGLLGMAFAPDYATSGAFYLYSTRSGGDFGVSTRIVQRFVRSAADPDIAEPASARTVIRIDGPIGIHNAGWIGFGRDDYLYIAVGERGAAANSQDITDNLFGKILRLDVSGDDFPDDLVRNYRIPRDNPFVGIEGDDEIWAYGLRNPWRCSFDRQTGALTIADVGSGQWEELDYQPATGPGIAGRNYGWPCFEGNATGLSGGGGCPLPPGTATFPFLVYGHTQFVPPLNATGCSIIGGEVYRGCAIPGLQGTYFFGDYCRPTIYSLRYDGTSLSEVRIRTGELSVSSLRSFGTDALGEVYYCSGGGVYKIIAAPGFAAPDCNNNGRPDPCDIALGIAHDANGDGVLDECACRADWDGNHLIQPADVAAFVTAWLASLENGTLAGDFDGSGRVQPADVSVFILAWFAALAEEC